MLVFNLISYAQNEGSASEVVSDLKKYNQFVIDHPEMKMVNLARIIPQLKVELIYATDANFTHVRMYPKNTNYTFMRQCTAEKLLAAAVEFERSGIGIKVWDAYRPYHVTQKFWDLIHDERYVANPSKGSGHNRGIAIDMTLYDLKTGKELDMPTGFDDFSEAAHHGYMILSEEKIKNREFLKKIMEGNGFKSFQTEWWHYYIPNPDKYPVMDITLKSLKN